MDGTPFVRAPSPCRHGRLSPDRLLAYFITLTLTRQGCKGRAEPEPAPLALPWFSRYFPPAVPKVYIVSFRTHDDRRPSKFIVLADSMESAIDIAWEHGGADFQSRFDKSTAQAQEMKEGALHLI
jgi:hypothetical protein